MSRIQKGRFIVLDGVEGCGKSTQAAQLAASLRGQSIPVVLTHEPGGTAIGEGVRSLLLDPAYGEMHEITETLLFCAARAQHMLEVIVPALDSGQTVICDRFTSSTVVYQGYAGGVGIETIHLLNDIATGGVQPDLLIILDIDPAEGMRRKHADRMDRIEGRPLEFHQRVREGFIRHAASLGQRAVVVDGDRAPQDIAADILALVAQ